MPKVKIVEKDLTNLLQLQGESNLVYIPGLGGKDLEPKLVTAIKGKDGLESIEEVDKEDLSYKLAKRLLRLGMPVLYQCFKGVEESKNIEGNYQTNIREDENKNQIFKINGVKYIIEEENKISAEVLEEPIEGNNGIYNIGELPVEKGEETVQVELIFKIDFIHNVVQYNIKTIKQGSFLLNEAVFKKLQDRSKYDIRFLTTGGHPEALADFKPMLECAAMRGDCVALIDHENIKEEGHDVNDIIDYFGACKNDIIKKTIFGEEVELPISAFGAGFTPWFKGELEDGEEEIPAVFGYLFAYARMIQDNPSWYAAAGSFRGRIPELKEVLIDYSNAEIEMLQARAQDKEVELDEDGDNVGVAINPIAEVSPFGHIVWGNRTLLDNKQAENGEVGVLKATSFLNVRNCISLLNKEAYKASRKYTFEPNNDVLWLNFKSEITPLLDKMQTGNGILGYKIERVETGKRARLGAKIRIIPIEGVEDFEIEIDLQDSISE